MWFAVEVFGSGNFANDRFLAPTGKFFERSHLVDEAARFPSKAEAVSAAKAAPNRRRGAGYVAVPA